MPFYRFHIDTALPEQAVMERIRSLLRERPGLWQDFVEQWKPPASTTPPFIGSVGKDSFRIYRDIRYRNSFLPRIWGRAVATPVGTRIKVTVFLHPFVVAFMMFWLGIMGAALVITARANPRLAVAPGAMFIFGLALTCGGFFPEAFRAKRLLSAAFADSASASVDIERRLGHDV